jgi:hypothetical protein
VLAVAPAGADTIYLSLTEITMFASPADTVPFDATVWPDPNNLAPVYLNGDSNTIDSPLTLDDSPFFANFPAFFNPWDNPVEATLFTVFVPPGTADGTYGGYFEVDGGPDDLTFDPLASEDFNVQVQPGSIPEPPSLALIGAGLVALGCGRARRKTARA